MLQQSEWYMIMQFIWKQKDVQKRPSGKSLLVTEGNLEKKAVKSNNIFQGHLLSLARTVSGLTTAALSGQR